MEHIERICAGCYEFIPRGADHCRCGYDSSLVLEEKTIRVIEQHADEVNYLAYYEARLLQAEEHLRDLIDRYGRSDWSPEQRANIKGALRAIANSKATVEQQKRRLHNAAQQLHIMLPRIQIDRLLRQIETKPVPPSFGLQADIRRLTTPQPSKPHAGAKEKFR